MLNKYVYAKQLADAGIHSWILPGEPVRVDATFLRNVLEGDDVGTYFPPKTS